MAPMNWLQLALALLQLAPQVLKLISEVEAAIGGGNGELKKVMVMAPLAGGPPEVLSGVGNFIDAVVAAQKKVTPAVASA